MLTIMLDHVLNLTSLAVLILVAAGTGNLILKKGQIPFHTFGEQIVFATGMGFGVLSTSVFFLGAIKLLNPAAVVLLLAVCAISAVFGWRGIVGTIRHERRQIPEIDFRDRIAGVLLLTLIGTAFLFVLVPAFGNDSLSYHLTVPRQYLAMGGFDFIPGNIFSNYPLNGEMLYVIALVLKGDVLAKGMHLTGGLLILWSMWQFGAVYLNTSPFKFMPLLIFFSIPTVFIISHTAYTDMFLTLYAFLALYAFLNWMNRKHTGWLILCAAGTGLSAATKYGGLFFPFLGCLAVLYADYRNRSDTPRSLFHIGIFVLVTACVGVPFYAKNWLLTGNPLNPFFHMVFDGKGWDADQARRYELFLRSLGMGRGLLDYLLLPFNLSFRARMGSPLFDGVLGPVFFLALPFLVVIRKIPFAVKACLFFAGACFAFWAASAQQIRYLIPVFPPLALAVGYAAGYFYRKKTLILLMVFVAFGFGVNGYHIGKYVKRVKPVRYLAGKEDRSGFLSRIIPAYDIFQTINSHLPADAKIFFIYMKNLGFLCHRNYYSDAIFESHTMEKLLARWERPEQVYDALKARGITHILYDVTYVHGPLSTFSAAGKKRFTDFQNQHLTLMASHKNRYFLFKMGNS